MRKAGAVWAQACVYIGMMVGGGFASGQELWQYFAVFGGVGWVLVVVAFTILAFLSAWVVSLAGKCAVFDQKMLWRRLFGGEWAKMVGFLPDVMIFVLVAAMFSAFAALLEPLGWAWMISAVVFAVLLLISASRMVQVQKLLVPPMLIFLVLLCVASLSRQGTGWQMAIVPAAEPAAGGLLSAVKAAVIYVGYNFLSVLPALVAYSKQGNGVGCVLGGGMLALAAFLGVWALSGGGWGILPFAGLAAAVSPVALYLFLPVMVIALLTTAVSGVYALSGGGGRENRRKRLLLVAFASVGAGVDFGFLVEKVYGLCGILGLLFIAIMLVGWCRNSVSRNFLP